jgi:uncharacterized protein YndB with AHSA1/START domain
MIINKETIYQPDVSNRKLTVLREFDATPERVWKAWSEPKLLDQWWAPKPWKAHTRSMDFREGGAWLYYMEGPDASRHYCRVDYQSIIPVKLFSCDDAFCDEKGNLNYDFPRMHWRTSFTKSKDGTQVDVNISFDTEADLHKIIEMGFKEGFAAAHQNLDELLAA